MNLRDALRIATIFRSGSWRCAHQFIFFGTGANLGILAYSFARMYRATRPKAIDPRIISSPLIISDSRWLLRQAPLALSVSFRFFNGSDNHLITHQRLPPMLPPAA
jgi:hypothetical protein